MTGDASASPADEQGPDADPPRSTRRNAALVSGGILVSRLTGLVRERALGHYFGTGAVADAFVAAFRIPNTLQHLLGEGVLSASFIPAYSKLLRQGRDEEAGIVAGAIAGLLAVAVGALALVGVLLAEPLTSIVAAGLRSRPETFDLAVSLVRILFPATAVLVLSSWCLGVLNSHRRFFLSYVAPAFLNVAQIAVLVVAGSLVLDGDRTLGSQERLALWLAWGTVAGGVLQFAIQLPGVRRVGGPIRPSLRTDPEGVRTTIRGFLPVVGARGVVQISAYVQVFLASFLAIGALAGLRYALILYMLPVSLFGMAVAASELPELSREDHGGSAVHARLRGSLHRVAALVTPAAIAYLVIGDLLVGALFQSGEFSDVDVTGVWIVLIGYALGLVATTSSRVVQSALYSTGDTRTPARFAIVRVATSLVLGAVLMVQFDRLGVTPEGIVRRGDLPAFGPLPESARLATESASFTRLGAAGISLAVGIAGWVEFLLLRRALGNTTGERPRLGGGRLRAIVVASAVAAAAASLVRLAEPLAPIVAGMLAAGVFAATYAVTANAVGVDEVRDSLRSVASRLRR